MIGDQSTGKTSVIEALVGKEISFKDSTMATCRPMLLTLMRTSGGAPYAVFNDGEKLHDFEMVKERVTAENAVSNGDISNIPVELTVFSPDVFDTILIDLPGFILVPDAGQDPELPEQITKLATAYMQDPLNLLAVVSSATQDPATSMALREAQRNDPDGNRCLGVVTKIDLMGKNKDSLGRLLRNEVLPLAMGRIGIRCRTHQEQLDGVSFADVVQREAAWIANESGMADDPACRLGVPLLRQELSRVLISKVCGQLPSIIQELDRRISEATHNQDFLARLATEPELTTVSRELEALVNQLHPASDSRKDLEESIRRSMYATVKDIIHDAYLEVFPAAQADVLDDLTVPTSKSYAQRNTIPPAEALLQALEYQPDERPRDKQVEYRRNIARFRELLVYGGEGHMDGIDSTVLKDVRDRGTEIGAITTYFDHALPENPRRARTAWMATHQDLVESLETKYKLVDTVFTNFMAEMESFAETAKTGEAEQAELAKLYFKYLLDKISTRIRDESLRQELIGMVDRERRPVCDFLELQNEIAKTAQEPKTKPGLLYGTVIPKEAVSVCMFSDDWTKAYINVMTKRVSDDLFRIMTVRLMEPLLFESISFTLKLFSNNAAIQREAKLQANALAELEELRGILQETLKTYQKGG